MGVSGVCNIHESSRLFTGRQQAERIESFSERFVLGNRSRLEDDRMPPVRHRHVVPELSERAVDDWNRSRQCFEVLKRSPVCLRHRSRESGWDEHRLAEDDLQGVSEPGQLRNEATSRPKVATELTAFLGRPDVLPDRALGRALDGKRVWSEHIPIDAPIRPRGKPGKVFACPREDVAKGERRQAG